MGVSQKVKKLYILLAAKLFFKKRSHIFLLTGIIFSCITLGISSALIISQANITKSVLGISFGKNNIYAKEVLLSPIPITTIAPSITPTPIPTSAPTPLPSIRPIIRPTNKPRLTPIPISQKLTDTSKYSAEKINDVTWRVKNVQNDDRMAYAQEIVTALNSYRSSRGRASLSWDNKLGDFAQERANLFSSNGSLDSHAGFKSFMENGGFDKSGFNSLGENSAYLSGSMNGENIIQKIYGADASHDGNQLDDWTHVGIGVSGVAINVNFGKNKK